MNRLMFSYGNFTRPHCRRMAGSRTRHRRVGAGAARFGAVSTGGGTNDCPLTTLLIRVICWQTIAQSFAKTGNQVTTKGCASDIW